MTIKVEFNEDEARAVLAALDEYQFIIDPKTNGFQPTEDQLKQDPLKYRLIPHQAGLKLVVETLQRVSQRIKGSLTDDNDADRLKS